jgi:hypothetical protein
MVGYYYENDMKIIQKKINIGTWLLVPIPLTRSEEMQLDPTMNLNYYSSFVRPISGFYNILSN